MDSGSSFFSWAFDQVPTPLANEKCRVYFFLRGLFFALILVRSVSVGFLRAFFELIGAPSCPCRSTPPWVPPSKKHSGNWLLFFIVTLIFFPGEFFPIHWHSDHCYFSCSIRAPGDGFEIFFRAPPPPVFCPVVIGDRRRIPFFSHDGLPSPPSSFLSLSYRCVLKGSVHVL